MSKIMEHHFPKLLGGDYIKGKAISVCMYCVNHWIIQLCSHSLKRQKVLKPANKRVQHKVLLINVVSTSLRPTLPLPQQASSNTVDLNMNGNIEEQLEEVSQMPALVILKL